MKNYVAFDKRLNCDVSSFSKISPFARFVIECLCERNDVMSSNGLQSYLQTLTSDDLYPEHSKENAVFLL
jgi:hypothetical protein